MATGQIGFVIWLTLVTAFWTVHPLLLAQTRGIIVLAMATGGLALAGCFGNVSLCVFWSGIIGLLNLTLALLLTSHAPDLWVGLSAGLTLLALLDGSQRWAYVRRCHLEGGSLSIMLDTFVRVSGLSLAAGLGMGWLLVMLSPHLAGISLVSLLTLAGACLFAGCFTLFLLYTNRLN